MKMSSAHLHKRLVSLTSLLAFTAVSCGAVQGAAVKKPTSLQATTRVRNLQPGGDPKTIELNDAKKIIIRFSSETVCSASIEDGSVFGTRACSCFMLCQTDLVSYDCSSHSDDPCAKVDCQGKCADGTDAETTFTTEEAPEASNPTASPVEAEEEAPSASPMEAESPSASPVVAPSASPVEEEEEEAPSASPVEDEAPSASPVVAPSASPVEEEEEEAPSASPVEDEAPSASPLVAPSASPVEGPMEVPTSSPESETADGESPSASPSEPPTSSPVDSSGSGTGDASPGVPAPTGVPSFSPSLSFAPFANETAPECAVHSACVNLTGACCPTVDGWILDCCDNAGPVEKTCELNAKCDELGLEGACCPTNDGFGYLDCCSPLPKECNDEDNDSCNVTSATDYLEFIQERDGAAALTDGSGAASLFTTAVILIISTVATLGLLI